MPRPALFARQDVLEAARTVVARRGPARATLQALARELGGPTGSIYHRFASRDLLLATLWLDTVESFQQAFLEAAARSPAPAALARFTIDWAARYPREARILILYRREELGGAELPRDVADRARGLNRSLRRALRELARRWLGSASPSAVDAVRLAVVELPYAAVRSRIGRNEALPPRLAQLVGRAAGAILSEARS